MKAICWILAALMIWSGPVAAQTLEEDGESGLKLPRFVSLRSNLINARSGPGARYPIEWVYMQKGAPVEIVAEFEIWRQIKDWQGSKTWVHKSMLSGHRSVKVITPGENNIYTKADYNSNVIAKVEDEVVGDILKCPEGSAFCQIKFDRISGWVPRQNLYGLYPNEVIE